MTEEVLKIKVDSTEVDKGSASLDKLAGSSKKAETATDGLTSATALLSRAVAVAAGSYATFKVTQYAQEALILSQRYQELGIAMSQIGRNAGVSRTQLDSTAKTLQKLGISMIESRQTVLSLVAANIDLAQAEKLADLARNAAIVGQLNTSQALNSLVHGVRSAQTEVLRNIGINVSFENSYKKLAAEMGVTTAALTEQQRMQGRMNAVLGEGAKLTGLYEQAMGNAGKQYRSTARLAEDLKVKVGAVFDATAQLAATTYTMILQSLGATVDSLAESGRLTVWGDNIARTFAFMGDAARSVIAIFKVVGLTIGATVAQFEAMARFDFAAVGNIQKALNADIKAQTGSMSTMRDELNKQIVIRDLLNVTTRESGLVTKQATAETEQNTITTDKATAAKHRLTLAELRVQESTKRTVDLYQDAKRLTDSVATSQDKYNAELAELNRLRPYVSVGTYDRALAKLNETTVKTATVTKTATDEVSQLWMQAGRNIQSTLANSIFNFFDDGLKGMVKNVGIAVGRILSEFAALRLAQSISLAGMFTAGGASASGGATSGANLLNIASLGTNAASLFKGGLGSMGLMSSIGGMLPGQAGAFFGGMGGGTVAGVSSTASLMGSSFAAVAGPAVALFAVDAIGRMLAGDKKLGGAEYIPVIGGFLAAMFGRGPLKQRDTVLSGIIGAEGFESGTLGTNFRAKGGLFRSNKNDFARVDLITGQISTDNAKLMAYAEGLSDVARGLTETINQTVSGFSESVTGFAQNLGLSTDAVDNYSKQIELKSEKGKQITEEAIAEMLSGISNEMAEGILPIVKPLKKAGEDSFDTLSRLNSEFVTLSGAARVLGLSLEDSKTAIRSAGFELRTSFVDAAGGVESFGSKIGFIADNFLTAEQRLAMGTEDLNAVLTKLGIPLGTTKDQFYELLQAAAQAGDAIKFGGLLDVAQIYLNVSSAAEQVMLAEQAHAQSITAAADKFLTAEQLYTRSSRNLNDELKSLGVSTDITKEGYLKLIQAGGDLGESLALLADHFLSVRNSSQYMTESLANSPRAGRVAELNAQRRKEQNDPYKWYAEFQENVVADMRASESLRTTTLLNRDPAEFLRQFNAAPSNAPRILDQATTDRVDALAAAIKNLGIAANDANFNLLAPAYNLNLVIERTGINFETLAGRLDYFANNFLDGSEKTKLASDAISQSLKSVGIASIENADKLKTLIMSFGSAGGVNAEQFSTLLEIAPLLKDQFDAQKNVNSVIDNNIVALRSAADIAQEKYGLESQLLQIQGNTTELRRRELDALDPSNRALQERIWALDDEKTAIDKLIAGVDTAFSALQRAVDGEKATLTAAFNSALAESEKRISSVSESVSKLTSLSELLKSTTGSINPLSLSEARGRVQLAVDSGNLNNDELRGAIETLGKQQSESDFSSRTDFMRGQSKNIGLLAELSQLTEKELTLEERTLSALEAAKRRIEDGFRADIERLDQIVTSAQTQIDVLRGIDISILTIPSAIAGLGASIQSANAAMAASASAAAAAASASAAALQQVAVKPFGLDDQPAVGMFRLVSGNEIPKFASGTSFVPRTGPAIVHQGERIINPEQNQDLIRLLGQLVQKIADGNADTAELLRVLKSMRVETDDGIAIRNQVAA